MSDEFSEADKAILRDAARYLSENGHIKGRAFEGSEEGGSDFIGQPACALGAIAACDPEMNGRIGDRTSIWRRMLRPYVPHPSGEMAEWNDLDETTAEDVILKLKELGS